MNPLLAYARKVLALGIVVWLASLALGRQSWPHPEALLWLCLSGFWAEWRSSYLPGYGVINFGEGLYLGASLRYGGPLAGIVAAFTGLACDRLRGKDPRVSLFNVGWALTTFALAGLAASGFSPENPLSLPSLGWAALAACLYGLSAGTLQAGCQTHMESMKWSQTLPIQIRLLRLSVPSAALLGLLTQALLGLAPWAILMVLFPVEMLAAYVRVDQLHRQLQQAQVQIQAQGRQAALGLMAAGIAHEINNPLAAISTSAQMLQRLPLPERANPCLDIMHKAVERCQSITERMLTYSRGEGDSQGPAQLAQALQDALLFLKPKLQTMDILGRDQLERCPSVDISPGSLVQVFTNLISNASDAGATCLQLEASLHTSALRLKMHDNGGGIPEKVRSRVFEPFFTTKPVGHGTGLGLSLCQGLIEKSGGKLGLQPTSQGTCFLLELPLYQPAPQKDSS